MTDLAQPAKNVNLGPVRSSISWTTVDGNALNMSGPVLVALRCGLAGMLGCTTYASHGSNAAIGMAPFAVRDADLWFCCPKGLKDGILKGLKALDQVPRRVRFENFEFA